MDFHHHIMFSSFDQTNMQYKNEKIKAWCLEYDIWVKDSDKISFTLNVKSQSYN